MLAPSLPTPLASSSSTITSSRWTTCRWAHVPLCARCITTQSPTLNSGSRGPTASMTARPSFPGINTTLSGSLENPMRGRGFSGYLPSITFNYGRSGHIRGRKTERHTSAGWIGLNNARICMSYSPSRGRGSRAVRHSSTSAGSPGFEKVIARAYVALYLLTFFKALSAEHTTWGESPNDGRVRGIDLQKRIHHSMHHRPTRHSRGTSVNFFQRAARPEER